MRLRSRLGVMGSVSGVFCPLGMGGGVFNTYCAFRSQLFDWGSNLDEMYHWTWKELAGDL